MKRYKLWDGRQACFFKVCENGWEIHFGPEVMPTTAFSEIAFHKELVYLKDECDYAIFTEIDFKNAVKKGIVTESEYHPQMPV